MRIRQVSNFCFNRGPSPSLEEQLCGEYLHQFEVLRRFQPRGCSVEVHWSDPAENVLPAKACIISPEHRFQEVRPFSPAGMCVFQLSPDVDYVNLLAQNAEDVIFYARSVILRPRLPVFFPSDRLVSPSLVDDGVLEIGDKAACVDLRFLGEPPGRVTAAAQMVGKRRQLGIARRGQLLRAILPATSLCPGLWSLVVSDEDGRFLAQVCLKAEQP